MAIKRLEMSRVASQVFLLFALVRRSSFRLSSSCVSHFRDPVCEVGDCKTQFGGAAC